MIIECPACETRAKFPDSKAGAKVRCSNCGRIYVAGGAGKAKQTDTTRYAMIGVGVVLMLIIMWVYNNAQVKSLPKEPDEVVVERIELAPMDGWDSNVVKAARKMHEMVFNMDTMGLRNALDPAPAWDLRVAGTGEVPFENEPLVATTMPGSEELWSAATVDQHTLFHTALIDELMKGTANALIADYKPYDTVVEADFDGVFFEDDKTSIVRLAMKKRDDPTSAVINVEWRFSKLAGKYKAYHWERYLSPEELIKRHTRTKKTTKRTLSDGSLVIEGKIRAIQPMDSTPPERALEIDQLVAKLINLTLPARELTKTRKALEAYAKEAIPSLLTAIAVTPLESEDQAIQLGLVHTMLTDITGYITTYKPSITLGATEERMDSGLKQWFGWYDRKFKRFSGLVEGEVNLPVLNDRDARDRERSLREAENEAKWKDR